MSHMITGLFTEPGDASAAINDLAHFVPPEDISIVASESSANEALAIKEGSKVGEGTAIGAAAGAGVGAIAGGLTAVGALAVTGVGLVAAGPLVAVLAGAGAGGVGGGVLGGLIGLGIPEHEVKFYQDAIGEGAVLVGVKLDDADRDKIQDVFEKHNASHVTRA